MKSIHKIALAAALLASFAGATAQADVTLKIAGSTAFRNAVHNAIARTLTGGSKAVYTGSNLATSSDAVFQGTITGSPTLGTITVQTHWFGSIAGIKALTQSTPINFVDPSNITGSTAATVVGGQSNFYSPFGLQPSVGGGTKNASATLTSGTADVAFSDVTQATGGLADPLVKLPAIPQTNVGVLPFVFLKGAASTGDTDYATWSRLTDITTNNVFSLYTQGSIAASLVTNNTLDSSVYLFATGRDNESGTRAAAFAESYFGVGKLPNQFTVNILAGTTAGPAGTVDYNTTSATSGPLTATNSGESSGGTLAAKVSTPGFDFAALSNSTSAFPVVSGGGYPIAYMGAGDTDTLVTEGYVVVTQLPIHGTLSTDPLPAGTAIALPTLSAVGSGVIGTVTALPVSQISSSSGTLPSGLTAIATGTGNNVTFNQTIPAGTYDFVVDTAASGYVRATFLTYNGVDGSIKANTQNGKYPFWEYEHYYVPSIVIGDKLTFSNLLKTNIINTDAKVAGYLLNDLKGSDNRFTKKTVEGGSITH